MFLADLRGTMFSWRVWQTVMLLRTWVGSVGWGLEFTSHSAGPVGNQMTFRDDPQAGQGPLEHPTNEIVGVEPHVGVWFSVRVSTI